MNLRVIITGATGMVGEGVLHECLNHSDVGTVLVLGRRPCGVAHPKLREIVVADFFDLSPVREGLRGYDACFFCLGVSSIGKSAEEYERLTHTLTMHAADTLSGLNPGMVFCYVSGAGTDSTEQGRLAWARVKGRTENDLMKLPFRQVYAFRPGFLRPTPGLRNALRFYRYVDFLYPVLRAVMPNTVSTLRELGLAMINAARIGYAKPVLEVKDIVELSRMA
jgi:uncharacterized protein YbjT (DUF2867 family)